MRRRVLRMVMVAWVLAWLPAMAAAQSPDAPQSPSPSPPAASPSPSVVAPSPAAELPSVEGAANPMDAPLLQAGSVVDTILQTETLWYAVDALPGQRVGATIFVGGRPDGPVADDTTLEVTVTDPQRQPLDVRSTPFTGQADGVIELPTVAIPDVAADPPLLSVALRSDVGSDSLAGTGYRLQLTVVIDGQPLPQGSEAPADQSAAAPAPVVTVTSPPVPPPGDPDIVGDMLPVALISLAVGGFAGFELSRRGL